MRNLLFMSIMVLVSMTAAAQRLNSRGEKMVSKIQLHSCDFRTGELRQGRTYAFKYNDNNQIVGLSAKYKEKEQSIVKEGNKITRGYFYDKNHQEKSISYEYLLDECGNIIQKNYYEGVGDALTTKEVWNFIYRYDDFSGRCIIDSLSYAFHYRDIQSDMKDYDFADGETEPYTLKTRREPNGLYYRVRYGSNSSWKEIGDQVKYMVGMNDDTNLNLNFLWGDAPYTIAGDTNGPLEFLVPEWINAKSGYLYSEDHQYEYISSKDNKGNIVRIEQVYKRSGKLRQVFTITYR